MHELNQKKGFITPLVVGILTVLTIGSSWIAYERSKNYESPENAEPQTSAAFRIYTPAQGGTGTTSLTNLVSSSTINASPYTAGYGLTASTTAASGLAWTALAGGGTVTSVAATVPTGWAISGSPITGAGTLAFTYDTGYAAVLTASTTNWNNFYDTPSTRITAGTGLSWSGNTLNGQATTTLDIRSFGAVCDGVTDDTLAIQSALTSAGNAGGGTIYIPAGTCITDNLTIYNSTTVRGTGTGSELKLKNSSNDYMFTAAATIGNPTGWKHNIVFDSLQFNLNGDNNTTLAASIEAYNIRNLTVKNSKFVEYIGNNISVTGGATADLYSIQPRIINNEFDSMATTSTTNLATSTAIYLGLGTFDGYLSSNDIGRSGIGVEIVGGTSTVKYTNHSLLNNWTWGNQDYGVKITYAGNTQFINHTSDRNFGDGIYLENASSTVFQGGKISNNSFYDEFEEFGLGQKGTTNTYSGLVASSSPNIRISNTLFTNKDGDQKYGILGDGANTTVYHVNAQFTENATDGLLAQNSATIANIDTSRPFKIGNLCYSGDVIYECITDTDTGTVAFNFNGFDGGTTRFRDFKIFDGKNNQLFFADGSASLVAIGNITPTQALDVNGSIRSRGGYIVEAGNVLKNSADTNKYGIWGGTDFSTGPFIELWPENSSSNNGNLLLEFGSRSTQLNNSYLNIAAGDGFGSGNSVVRILKSGNVGIGTTTPSAKLQVDGSSGGTIFSLFSDTGTKFLEMLNTGVTTLLGVWDFGGATSFEIPNGTNCTVDATGEHCFDTTTGQLIGYNGSSVDVYFNEIPRTLGSIGSTSPDRLLSTFDTATTTWSLGNSAASSTITSFFARTDQGTCLVRIGDGTNWSAALTASSTSAALTSLSNNTFIDYEEAQLQIGSCAGSPNYITPTVMWTETRQ